MAAELDEQQLTMQAILRAEAHRVKETTHLVTRTF
jgi:hypothetical protein